ncbi:MAG: beta-Ala-His dipeptidase [Actinomycetota bacterium]
MIDTNPYDGLEPAEVWRHFLALNHIPRPSAKEAAALNYVREVAASAGATADTDACGNVVVRASASPGREGVPLVAIQAHLDMVCEKRPDVSHDFDTDPIRPRREGDRVFATGTTLGADNGIGAAMALAALTMPGLERGPLELVFTVEEETGLTGALALEPDFVHARRMINLDSEDPLEITIGCAGGSGMTMRLPVTRETAPEGWEGREIVVAGLQGGHSGIQIHEPLANAIKLLLQVLRAAREAGSPFRLVSVTGGNAHNAIPRDACTVVVLPSNEIEAFQAVADRVHAELCDRWKGDEPGLELHVLPLPGAEPVLGAEQADALLQLLDEIPHGVIRMSDTFAGKVETSSNLAMVRTTAEAVTIATSSRSFNGAALHAVQQDLLAIAARAGAEADVRDGYPAWQPDPHSALLATAKAVYTAVHGREPEVQVIHAGLECGVIASKLPGLEAISFGPLIRGAHTPEEHVYISTVAESWRFLTALLKAIR